MGKLLIILAVSSMALVVGADSAFAWGPAVHLSTGHYILTHLNMLPMSLATLIFGHANAFLYGCLSADIFVGKGSKPQSKHSHNWSTAFELLQSVSKSEDTRVQAYAYGYLAHLAADTIAHNYFVPNMLCVTPGNGKFGHVYVESLADVRADWDRVPATRIFKRRYQEADVRLRSATRVYRVPFFLKKQIYRGGLFLAGRETWKATLAWANRNVPLSDSGNYYEEMIELARRAAFDVLLHPEDSPVFDLDPIGAGNLAAAQGMRPTWGTLLKPQRFKPPFPVDPCLECLILPLAA